MRVIVTGGAGFIGSAVCRHLVTEAKCQVLNVDKLTYAGNLRSLDTIASNPLYEFLNADICDFDALVEAFDRFEPDAVMHLAAESHVDRSISGAADFIQTNIVGTYTLLEAARQYWCELRDARKGCVPLPARVDRRGLRIGGRGLLPRANRRMIRARHTPPAKRRRTIWSWHGIARMACRL